MKIKVMKMFLLGGGVGANKVHYGRCVSGVLMNRRVNSKGNGEKLNVFPMRR